MRRLSVFLAWVCLAVAAIWAGLIILMIVTTGLHLTPYRFLDLVVLEQIRGTDDWPKLVHHTKVHYLARFFISTLIIELLGLSSYSYLRRIDNPPSKSIIAIMSFGGLITLAGTMNAVTSHNLPAIVLIWVCVATIVGLLWWKSSRKASHP